ncbi:hypothetical protein HAX54_040182 [Datura stramonium]|uniref:Uncharacterized protein n=1 Tax=Datura stramonium TaxID=4076 RepID=A0ABS8VQW4_DATST|nr:hypothetical protein [Datura stramonium]
MASLTMPSSTTNKTLSSSSSYFLSSCCSSLSSRNFLPKRTRRPNCVNCEINEAANEKPIVPIINDETLPTFLQAKRLQNAVNRNNTKLKIFSGTANPSLSQVNNSVYEDLGMPSYKYCHILTIVLNATGSFLLSFVTSSFTFAYHYPYSLE